MDLLHPKIKPGSSALHADSLPTELSGKPLRACKETANPKCCPRRLLEGIILGTWHPLTTCLPFIGQHLVCWSQPSVWDAGPAVQPSPSVVNQCIVDTDTKVPFAFCLWRTLSFRDCTYLLLSGRSSTHLRNWRINTQQCFSTVASFVCYKPKYSGPVSQPVGNCLYLDRNRLRFHTKEIWVRTGHVVFTWWFYGAVIALIVLVPGALNTESCSLLNQTLGKPTGVSGCWQQKCFLGPASPPGSEWGVHGFMDGDAQDPKGQPGLTDIWPHSLRSTTGPAVKISPRTENSNSWALTFLCKGSLLTTLEPWWICSQQALRHFKEIFILCIYFIWLHWLLVAACEI